MAKVEELMALMIEEINRYEQLVKKMEKLQQTKLEVDISNLQAFLADHEQKMEKSKASFNQCQLKMEKLMENANVYPKWAVIIFLISYLLNLLLIMINFVF